MKHYKRGFLNKGEGMAAFEADIYTEQCDTSKYIYASFAVTDCNRKVSLDFSCYKLDDSENSIHKMDMMINELLELRGKLVEAIAWAEYEKEAE